MDIKDLLARAKGLSDPEVLGMIFSNRMDMGSAQGGLISSAQFGVLAEDLMAWRAWTTGRKLLRCVSLTGADDAVSLEKMAELSGRYPQLEWALLYSPHSEGAPRNPSRQWREQFFAAKLPTSSAVHLCGRQAFEELLAGTLPAELLLADRIQLNINARRQEFTDDEVLAVFSAAARLGPVPILQYHAGTAAIVERFLAECDPTTRARVHVLFDESRGTGQPPKQWTEPKQFGEVFCGYAGGLGPDNVASVSAQLNQFGRPYWVDMETGLRTDNVFQITKARQVLERLLP